MLDVENHFAPVNLSRQPGAQKLLGFLADHVVHALAKGRNSLEMMGSHLTHLQLFAVVQILLEEIRLRLVGGYNML